jgi:hypothetical protein
MRMRCSAVVALVLGLSLAGCGGGSSTITPGATCAMNSECASGLTCSFGRCQAACKEARDCANGEQCVKNGSGVNSCLLREIEMCNYNSQCPAPLVCAADLKCRNQCLGDRDCATSTQRCVLPDRVCAEPSAIGASGILAGAVTSADSGVPGDALEADAPVFPNDASGPDLPPEIAVSPADASRACVGTCDGATAGAPGFGGGQTGGSQGTGGTQGAGGVRGSGGAQGTGGSISLDGGTSRPAGYYYTADWNVTSVDWHGCVWTAADNATSVTPQDFVSGTSDGGPYRVSGTVYSKSDAYALVGFNLNQAVTGASDQCKYSSSGTTADGPPALTMPTSATGIALNWTAALPITTALRIQIQGVKGATDANARWCATITDSKGPSFLKFSDFFTSCWSTSSPGNVYRGEPIDAVAFDVVGSSTQKAPFDITVLGFAPGTSKADAPGQSATRADAGTGGTDGSVDAAVRPGTWVMIASNSPKHTFPGVGYDPALQRAVLFGGNTTCDETSPTNRTWEWDGASWTLVTPTGDIPTARAGIDMAFDRANSEAVVHGGWQPSDYPQAGTYVYELGAHRWTSLGTKLGVLRWYSMGYDTDAQLVRMFGGNSYSNFYRDVRTWTPATQSWPSVAPDGPSVRAKHGWVYDQEHHRFVMFGGIATWSDSPSDNTWEYDPSTTTWQQTATTGAHPQGFDVPRPVYDPRRKVVVMYSYQNGGETWEYDAGTHLWANVAGANQIGATSAMAAFYDEKLQAVLAVGGCNAQGLQDGTWQYIPPN